MEAFKTFNYSVPLPLNLPPPVPVLIPPPISRYQTLWMDTIYFYFTQDFHGMNDDHTFCSSLFRITGLEGFFNLSVHKLEKYVVFQLNKMPLWSNNPPRDGYQLRIKFTMIKTSGDGKQDIMQSNRASMSFHLDEIKKHDLHILKLVIWLNECVNYSPSIVHPHEYILQSKIRSLFPTPEQLETMAFLLGRPSFQGILTGRQDDEYAKAKTELIFRSFFFADELAHKLRCFQTGQSYESEVEMSEILGFIYHGKRGEIGKEDCLFLYMRSVHFGFFYLKRECADFILANINEYDLDYVVRVLSIVELVDDKFLQRKVMKHFLGNEEEIFNSTVWKNLRNQCPAVTRSILENSRKFIASDDDEVDSA